MASPSPQASADQKPEQDHVTLTYTTLAGDYAFAPIAVQEEFFQKYGVDVTTQYAQSGTATAAVISGQAQFVTCDGVLALAPYAAGGPTEIIANFNPSNPYGLFGRPDVATIADLRGQTVAIGQIGDATDVSLRTALQGSGLVVGQDVSELPGGNSPGRFAALDTGQVGGAILAEGVFGEQAQAKGMHLLVDLGGQKTPWLGAALVTTTTFARDNPKTVLAVMKGVLEGVEFFTDPNNKSASLAALARDMQAQPTDQAVLDAYSYYSAEVSVASPDPDQAAVDSVLTALRGADPSRYSSVDGSRAIDHSFISTLRSTGYLD